MGFSYQPILVNFVSEESLQEKYPELIADIKNLLEEVGEVGECLDIIAQSLVDGDNSTNKFLDKLKELKRKFKEDTGAKLLLGYHNKNMNGDLEDEVSGYYFHAEGVRELSESGRKVDNQFDLSWKGFVVFQGGA